MEKLNKKFCALHKKNKKAFIAFIMAGDPDIETTERLIDELSRDGADIIELGVPFSDPLADGPTIQAASARALAHGLSLNSAIKFVGKLRKRIDIPLVLLSYYNPIYRYGAKRFIKDSGASGVDGIIVPDLPPEEGEDFFNDANHSGLATILLASPTSTQKRLKRIAELSSGFIYYVSLTGTTGARERLPQDIIHNVRQLKAITDKPVCVGFGISTPQQAGHIARVADGVIVGSAIIKLIEQNINPPKARPAKGGRKDLIECIGDFVRQMRIAI